MQQQIGGATQPTGPLAPHRANKVFALGLLGLLGVLGCPFAIGVLAVLGGFVGKGPGMLVGCLLGAIIGPGLAAFAWVGGNRDLRAMETHRMDRSGWRATYTGRTLGIAAVCLFGAGVGVCVIFSLVEAALFVGMFKLMQKEMDRWPTQRVERIMDTQPAPPPSRQGGAAQKPTTEPRPGAAGDATALVAAGMAAKSAGKLDQAAAKFRQAIAQDPKNPEAHWGLAWVLAAQRKDSDAVREFQQVTKLATDPQMRRDAASAATRLSSRGPTLPRPPTGQHAPTRAPTSVPEAGQIAPEIAAREWLNVESPPSIAASRGNVVLVEFWGTWCPPCRTTIPHLNEVYRKYKPKGLRIISLTRENRQTVQSFMRQVPISYPVGLESSSGSAYGVTGIPHAYLVGKDGKVLWHGHPALPDMERQIAAALS